MLQREIADLLIRGTGLRDSRLQNPAAISVTGVQVSADLGSARVFVDVLSSELAVEGVVGALNAASGWIRGQIGHRIHLKRVPTLRFEHDQAIAHGAKIERVLAELRDDSEDGTA